MKKLTIFIFLIMSFGFLNAQNIKKSDLKKADWFVDSEDFYKSDTVSIIKIVKFNSKTDELNKTYIKLQYNHNRNITELVFRGNEMLNVENLNVENWTTSKLTGNWNWNLKNQIIYLFLDKKLRFSFKIISQKKDSLVWKMEDGNKQKLESSIDLFVITLLRI